MKSVERSEEMITICKTLAECTHDDAVEYDALRILANTYHQTGQQALVEPTLEQIPEIYFTKLQQMAFLLEGDKSLDAARKQMRLSLDEIVEMLLIMRGRLLEKGEDADASKYGRIARRILEVSGRKKERLLKTAIIIVGTEKLWRSCNEKRASAIHRFGLVDAKTQLSTELNWVFAFRSYQSRVRW